MRLLRIDEHGELSLEDPRSNGVIPPYAILSHTWGGDGEEVTFEDLTRGPRRTKVGYRKLRFCAGQAARDQLQYFWVDTCCIDKSSSAELSEAINSMFNWYQNAARCYVYLTDVSATSSEDEGWIPAFRDSRWFTRGWTLQELLAPASVEFFSLEGNRLGDKRSLEQTIHEVSGISIQALRPGPLSDFSVEERLLWARRRNTKREEDSAYSLFGILGVHLPLLYGEGQQSAMKRLQREVTKNADEFRMPTWDIRRTVTHVQDGITYPPSNPSKLEKQLRADCHDNTEPDDSLNIGELGNPRQEPYGILSNKQHQVDIFQKRKSLAHRRKSWAQWSTDTTELFEGLQRWLSVPQASIFVVKSDPDFATVQRATDFAVTVTELLNSKKGLTVIWGFSFPVRPFKNRVPVSTIFEGLLHQAARCNPNRQIFQLTPSEFKISQTEKLYQHLLEVVSKLSECYVIIEMNDREWANRLLESFQQIVNASTSSIKFMVVLYGKASQQEFVSTQNGNRIVCTIHQAPRRKAVLHTNKWEDICPAFSN